MTKHVLSVTLDHRLTKHSIINECLAFDNLNQAFVTANLLCQDVLDEMKGKFYDDCSIDIQIAESVPVSYNQDANLPLGALDEHGKWCLFSYADRDQRIVQEVRYEYDQLGDALPDLSPITNLSKGTQQ